MGNQQATCCICLDKRNRGVLCGNKHLTCKECFPQYVKSCYENGAKFCDQGFVIRCPDPGCMSNPWSVADLRENLSDTIMTSYIESLIRYNNRMKSGIEIPKESVKQQLMDALNLKCPSCKTVLDQNPDGCCAMRCINCGTHFCWLCFQIFSGTVVCHSHVASCRLNPSRNLFAPATDVRNAHKLRRIKQLHAVLKAAHDPAQHGALGWKETNQTRTLLNDCSASLKLNELTPKVVLSTPEMEDRPEPPPAQPNELLRWLQQNHRNGAFLVAGMVLFYILSKLFSPSVTSLSVPSTFHSVVPYTTVYQDNSHDEDTSSTTISTKVLSLSLCPKHAKDTDERYIDFTKHSTTSGSVGHSRGPTSGAIEIEKAAKLVFEMVTADKNPKGDTAGGASYKSSIVEPFLCMARDGLHVYYDATLANINNIPVVDDSKSKNTKAESFSSFLMKVFNSLSGGLLCAAAVYAGLAQLTEPLPRVRRRNQIMAGIGAAGVIAAQVLVRVLWFVWEYSGTLFLIIAIGGGVYANLQQQRRG